jgi:hypothetical protein
MGNSDRIARHLASKYGTGWPRILNSQAAQLPEAFEALPEDEERVFTLEFLPRAVPFESGPLNDLETADAAHQLLASLE